MSGAVHDNGKVEGEEHHGMDANMKLKCFINGLLFITTVCAQEPKMQLFMFWEDSMMTFGAKGGFLPSLFIKPLQDSGSFVCCDTLYHPRNVCFLSNERIILDTAFNEVDSIMKSRKYISYDDTSRPIAISKFIKKPFLLSEGIKNRLYRIKKRYSDSIVRDTIILSIKYSTSNKALLYCIKELYQNGYKYIYVFENNINSWDVWSAHEIVKMDELKLFRTITFPNIDKITSNLKSIRNKLLVLK
jgi:hypothetical protein